MKHLTNAFLLTIILFVTSASGDVVLPPRVPEINVPPQGMTNCGVNADVRINLKPNGDKILAEAVGNFDISCPTPNQYMFMTESDIAFPVSYRNTRDIEVTDFRAEIDDKSVPVQEKTWTRFRREYNGYILSAGVMPVAKRRLTIRYSLLMTPRYDAVHKPESEKRKYCTYDFLLAGANFSGLLSNAKFTVTGNEALLVKIESPQCKKISINKQNEIIWEIVDNYKREDDIRLTIEMLSDGK